MKPDQQVDVLRADIAGCRNCAAVLPHAPRPVLQLGAAARIVIVSQAPGRAVHDTDVPWHDASGQRLRAWTGLPGEQFYDPECVALIPMGLCYPGRGEDADLPPRRECAPLWHSRIRSCLTGPRLTLLVGQYAQHHYLPQARRMSVTQRVRSFDGLAPDTVCLPHPSWRSTGWMTRNPSFAAQIIPELPERVARALGEPPAPRIMC